MKMRHTTRRLLLCGLTAAMLSGVTMAQQPTVADNSPVFGTQLMTEQERTEHRARMWAAQTPDAREQVRLEHHQKMLERAAQRGVTLPDEPPQRIMGQGRNPGQAPGMGAGRMQGDAAGQGQGRYRQQ